MSKTDNYIFWLLKILLGLCLLTPLLASGSFLFPYTSPKGFAFRILVEISAVFYFYLVLKYPANFLPPFKKGGLTRLAVASGEAQGGFLNLAVLSFLAVWLLSAVFGVDFGLSFWGNMERMIGVWGMIHFVLFFFMLQAVFKTGQDWEILLKVSVGASSLISVLAVGQKFINLGDLMPQTDRVFATIGNPAFLATYLIFNIFFAVYLALKMFRSSSGDFKMQRFSPSFFLYSLFAILNSFVLFLTGTRGAFLGFLAGVIVFLILFIIRSFSPHFKKGGWGGFKNWPIIFLSIIILLSIGLFFARNSSFIQSNAAFKRLVSISLSDTTAQNRLILWQESWLAWREKPMFGFGPENFEVAANKYFDPRLNPYEAWYDKAHNFIFDYGATTGWLGFLSYLFLIAAALFYLWKTGLKNPFLSITFGSLLAAYLAQNFFVFDTFIAYLMLFFVLALISGAEEEKNNPPLFKGGRGGIFFPPLKKFLLVISAILAVFLVYSSNLKPLLASARANQILASSTSDSEQITRGLREALGLKTFASPEIVYQVTMDYLSKISDYPQLAADRNFYELASAELSEDIKNSPRQARYYVALAWLDLYFYDRPDKINSAVDLAEKVKTLAPAKKDAYFILAAAYALSDQPGRAEQIIAEAYGIDKILGDEVEAYWNNLNK